MGRGGGRGGAKHSKNNCAGATYTNYERNVDKKQDIANGKGSYGLVNQRLGGDSVKDWDCCSLCLKPCDDPVVTTHGILFEREVIYEYILKEKKRIAAGLKAYDKDQAQSKGDERAKRKADHDEQVRQFEATECGILPAKKAKTEKDMLSKEEQFDTLKEKKLEKGVMRAAGSALGHRSMLEGEGFNNRAKDSCFWIADLTPDAVITPVVKPDEKVYCPISKKHLKIKDLISVKFTPLEKSADKVGKMSNHNERWMCPISKKTLGNSVAAAILRKSGDVISKDVFDTVIKKDMRDPFTGELLTAKDIIFLQRGSTGFSAGGVNLVATSFTPALRT
mmetsp:Transcript_13294/g.32287  ORF Transcript_13294/g.32287 Transcript_13294/m.32287 type:complete len:335 (-) Transcript_13294:166-1170(-)